MQIVLAYSGGLDTSFCVAYLTRKLKAEVSTVIVNTGGLSRQSLDQVAGRAREMGAVRHYEIDAREAVFNGYISTLIRGNVLRGGVYPLSVAAERTQQAIEVAKKACELNADAIAHGSTGAGNDQVRFDVAFSILVPDLMIMTPIRDMGLAREQAIEYLTSCNLEIPGDSQRYSVNAGLWGTTLGGEWTHDSWQGPPADAWGDGEAVSREPRDVVIQWESGLPVALDGFRMAGPELVEAMATAVGEYQIGRGIHIGETVLGIKGRIGFEAGAATALIHAHRELEKLVLTRWQAFWKDHLSQFWGDRLHEGQAFDPVMDDIAAMIESSQSHVVGETRLRFESGRFSVTGVRSPNSLMDESVARYGEENALWTGDEARAFAKISSIPSLLATQRSTR
ncbi:MAG: argininosuccinate synthase [bacterium]|nr:argininosuccinate synthase [bacterium]